jgi:hypothetical protein
MSKSESERDSKEAMLYEYIRSQEFSTRMEQISRVETQFNLLQDKEEKEHEKMWKDRKGCISQLIFYTGAFGYTGGLEFLEDGCSCGEVIEAKHSTNISTAIPLFDGDASRIVGRETENQKDPQNKQPLYF